MKKPDHSNASTTSTQEPSQASAFLAEAYDLPDQNSMKQFYAKWAEGYDNQMIQGLHYLSPVAIADILSTYITDRESRILDIGCGTGLTCKPLAQKGYNNLYGVDLSEDMIDVADSRGIYKGLQTADVNLPLSYADNYFDAVISSGTFTHGHVGADPLIEIFRIIQPGGILACTIHLEMWEKRGFEKVLSNLEKDNTISCLSREMGRYFEDKEPEGWFCVYQKRA